MKRRNKNRYAIFKYITVLVVVFTLVIGMILCGAGLRQKEPENPITPGSSQLIVEQVPAGYQQDGAGEKENLNEDKEEKEEEAEKETEQEDILLPANQEQTSESEDDEKTNQSDGSSDNETGNRPGGESPEGDTDSQEKVPGGDDPGTGEQENPGDGNGGDEGPNEQNPEEGPSSDSDPHLVTNLTNCVMTYSQLEEDILPFEAYIVNGTPDMYLRVKIQNSHTATNGDYLTADGRNYQTVLAREETNRITIYIREGDKTISTYTYNVLYVADKADENHPDVGEHPPEITTSLDSWIGEMTNRNYTMLVRAKKYNGQTIYSSSITVTMDGKVITNPTGSGVYEYELYFPQPYEGDYTEHTITVLAWDDEGNSAYRSYHITYHYISSGDIIGTAYVVLDMTTVGLDIVESFYAYEIRQDEPATYAVVAMLKDCGYECEYAGSLDDGFYLRRISRGGLMDYAKVPDNLWQKILDDGITLTGKNSDSLGEFDYTQGSGWMYSVNGELYAGKSISSYFLSDGDTIYLRFTLAQGKDLGATNRAFGKLSTYCGKWINGSYIDQHQWESESFTREPTCTEPGEMSSVCSVCGDRRNLKNVEPLGHDYKEIERKEPAGSSDGWIKYECTRCRDSYTEPISQCAEGHQWGEVQIFRQPTCTEGGEQGVVCTVCGEVKYTEAMNALGHDYKEIKRQEPTETENGWIKYKCSRCDDSYEDPIPRTEPDNKELMRQVEQILAWMRVERRRAG